MAEASIQPQIPDDPFDLSHQHGAQSAQKEVGLWSEQPCSSVPFEQSFEQSELHYFDISEVPVDALKYFTSLYALVVLWEGEHCLHVISEAAKNHRVPTIVAHEDLNPSERARIRVAGADFVTPFPLQDELIHAMKATYQRLTYSIPDPRDPRDQDTEQGTSSHVNASILGPEQTEPDSEDDLDARKCSDLALSRASSLSPNGKDTTSPQPTIFQAGPLVLDSDARTVTVHNEPIQLSTRPYELLYYLIQNLGRCCSRPELLEEVWNLGFDPSTNVVDVQVCELRRALSSRNAEDLIQTVRGSGYVLVASPTGPPTS